MKGKEAHIMATRIRTVVSIILWPVLVAGAAEALAPTATPLVHAQGLSGNTNLVPRALKNWSGGSLDRNTGETGVQIQNLDQVYSATITADYFKSAGAWEMSSPLLTAAPGAAANLWLPATGVPSGAYAINVNAERPIATIARTDWPASGGAAIYSNPIPGKAVILPLAVRSYFDQTSSISVQNTDRGAQATITVAFFESGAATPAISNDYSIPAGTSITMNLGDDLEFAKLGTGFLGSIVVTSETEVAVMSFVHIGSDRKVVYAFEGVPADMASTTLYAPLFRAQQYVRSDDPSSGRLDTGIAVANPGTSSVAVTITYYGAGGSCSGEVVTTPAVTIPTHSSHVFYQGYPAGQGLPVDCYGSAVIQSAGGGILAIVNEAQNLNQTAAAYNAVPAERGGTTVALPLYRKAFTGGAVRFNLTTGISVMNVGAGDATITVNFRQGEWNGPGTPVACGAPCSRTVGANQAAIFWPGSISEIPSDTWGAATVHSTEPVIVIVNDVDVSGAVDMATYNGIKVDIP